MSYPKEYAEMIYVYLANERVLTRTTGVSDKRRKLLISNNKIIKKNINTIYGVNKFQGMYDNITDGKEKRILQYTIKIDSKQSSGEAVLADKLAELKLPFFQEVAFDDLSFFRFDFFLPYSNAVIEVDGPQHKKFTPEYHKTEADFIKQRKNDNIKRKFAYKNNIIYVRFNYSELGNIEAKLRANFVIK